MDRTRWLIRTSSRAQGYAKGNFPIFPQSGCPGDDITNCKFPAALRASKRINSTVEASPGYFAVSLNTSIHTEITVTNHTALYRMTFPGPSSGANATATANSSTAALPYSPLILIDLMDLADSRSNGSVAVDASTGRIIGNGTFEASFGIGTYDLHFCADFRGAAVRDTGVFQNNRPGSEPKSLRTYSTGATDPVPAGAWVQFHPPEGDDDQILVRVGVSYLSTDRACRNAEAEIGDFDFDATRAAAEEAWRAKLRPVSVDGTGVNATFLTTFWSGLYRSLLSPQDVTGENPLWNSSEPCE